MGRWRAPQKAGSPYITPEGAKCLKEELVYLWKKLRPEVVKAITVAAAEGDRSENAEYIYRKKQLGEIDRRLRYLSGRVDIMKIVKRPPTDVSMIRFGAWITLEDPDEGLVNYRIVVLTRLTQNRALYQLILLLRSRCWANPSTTIFM